MDKFNAILNALLASWKILLAAVATIVLVFAVIAGFKYFHKNPLLEKKPTSQIANKNWKAVDLTDENNALEYLDAWFSYYKFRYVLEECIPNKTNIEDCHK